MFNEIKDVPLENLLFPPGSSNVSLTNIMSRNINFKSGNISIGASDGSNITLGLLADSSGFGIGFYDSSGKLQAKFLGSADYKYRADGTNYYQAGVLPDGSYDLAIAATGDEVKDIFPDS